MLVHNKYNNISTQTLDKAMDLALDILADQLPIRAGVQKMNCLLSEAEDLNHDSIFDAFRIYRQSNISDDINRIDIHVACMLLIIKYRIDPIQRQLEVGR